MNNSESGRKLNQAVNTTSKAVGGAILQAKGALSNWWSAMTTQPPVIAQSLADPDENDPSSAIGCDDELKLNGAPVEHLAATPSESRGKATASTSHPVASNPAAAGVVEIGHEAVAALDSDRCSDGKVFTV